MSTDDAWRRWGQQDPYFAVITDPKYRAANLTDETRAEFFESGRLHARYVLNTCQQQFGVDLKPRRALDFGCGVGRVTLAMAELVDEVTGVDVSPAMLDEAQRSARERGVHNVSFALSDDTLSGLNGKFDLVHSFIVLQHIDVPRGRALFHRLVQLVGDGGAGALHVTYAKATHADRYGQPQPRAEAPARKTSPLSGLVSSLRRSPPVDDPTGDPEMQMNVYALNELFYLLQTEGIRQLHVSFTDHGGEMGAFIFFRRPATQHHG